MERSWAPLIGREPSLGLLRSAVGRAADGRPGLLLVSGETGVGKTRLVRELVATEELTLLHGACVPMAGDPLPYGPLVQALHRLSRTGRWNLQLQRSPDLARLVPDIDTTSEPGPAAVGVSSPLGLFQAVLTLLERLAAAVPAALVVEDVQWADRSTLDLVRFIATNMTTERIVVVLTYRDEAIVPGTSLALWLSELARLDVAERVPLERLGREDTVRLVTALLGPHPDPALVQSTMTRSAGNPLFAEHLVLQGEDDGRLPATLSELLLHRVAALPDQTRRVLRAAAVVGRPSEVDLVARTMGSTTREVEAQLRPALDQHILEVRRDGTISFRHPAFAEVVYAELLPGERSSLHRAAALALDPSVGQASRHGPDSDQSVAGELARHWAAAGDVHRALDAAVTAGTAAERMFAFSEAHTHFARAAELVPQVPGSPHQPVRLLKHAAQAASLMGDGDEAVRLLERALSLTDDPQVRASLCARLGSVHYLAGRGQPAQQRFREALALVPPEEESVLVARIHAGLGLLAAAWSQFDEADESCTRGLAVARAVGARREEGLVHSAMGVVASARGDTAGGVGHLREALTIAREVGNPNDLGTAYINLSHVLGLAGRQGEVVDLSREGIEALARVGLTRQSGSFLKANASHALIDSGRLSEATTVIEEALSHHPRGIRAAPVLIQASRVDMVRGDLDQARERLARSRQIIASENAPDGWLRELIEVAAEVELWAGRPAAAYELVTEGLTLVLGTDEESFAAMLVALGLRALADQAETRRDPTSQVELQTMRRPLEDARVATESTHVDSAATAAWQRAEAARLDRLNDPDRWAQVARLWQELDRPIATAYARWREAEARLELGVEVEAIAAVRHAHAAAVEVGATQIAAEVGRLAGWYHVDLVPVVAEPDPDALHVYRLTPREVEVLTGLAAGRTNQEIADQLFISVKTASVHVSNILRKLDVPGRREAGRVAHRLGVGG